MDSLLFLAHRLPYPPNKGDKVRSFHFLRHLATRYRVHVGTFIDDPADRAYVAALAPMCADLRVETLDPAPQRVRSAVGFATGEALTLPYFRSAALAAWVRETLRRVRPRAAFAFSAPMAQYVIDEPRLPCVVDFVDVDSAKWDDYAHRRRWPLSAVYAREGRRLRAFEKCVAERAAASVFVTEAEATLFRERSDPRSAKVVAIRNGVDTDYFAPASGRASPYPPGVRAIAFTGAMDYWPNVDAVSWFAREVLPSVRAREPNAVFYVVGMNPDGAVQALARDGEVVVTGRVDDVRPYLQHAAAVVAPLRVARGIQNKVLEAMAMERPVVLSPEAAAGLSSHASDGLVPAADAAEFAAKVLAMLTGGDMAGVGAAARSHVLAHYAWQASFAQLSALLDGVATDASPGGTRGASAVPVVASPVAHPQ